MTHAEKFERRRQMAEAVRGGKDPNEVAQDFRVTSQLVLIACREHGVDPNAPKANRARATA